MGAHPRRCGEHWSWAAFVFGSLQVGLIPAGAGNMFGVSMPKNSSGFWASSPQVRGTLVGAPGRPRPPWTGSSPQVRGTFPERMPC